MHLKIKVAEIKMERIVAGCDFVAMETRFMFHFDRPVSGSTDYEMLGAREELSERDLRLRGDSVCSELPAFPKNLMLPSSGRRMLIYPAKSAIIFL